MVGWLVQVRKKAVGDKQFVQVAQRPASGVGGAHTLELQDVVQVFDIKDVAIAGGRCGERGTASPSRGQIGSKRFSRLHLRHAVGVGGAGHDGGIGGVDRVDQVPQDPGHR